jgi:hypothetical protein
MVRNTSLRSTHAGAAGRRASCSSNLRVRRVAHGVRRGRGHGRTGSESDWASRPGDLYAGSIDASTMEIGRALRRARQRVGSMALFGLFIKRHNNRWRSPNRLKNDTVPLSDRNDLVHRSCIRIRSDLESQPNFLETNRSVLGHAKRPTKIKITFSHDLAAVSEFNTKSCGHCSQCYPCARCERFQKHIARASLRAVTPCRGM